MNSRNFNYWWVWPVTLNAGQNTLLLEGANGFSGGPFHLVVKLLVLLLKVLLLQIPILVYSPPNWYRYLHR